MSNGDTTLLVSLTMADIPMPFVVIHYATDPFKPLKIEPELHTRFYSAN